jgi:hypothetical protein
VTVRPPARRRVYLAQRRVAPAQVTEWAGHTTDVLLGIYAKCIAGQQDEAKRRIFEATKPVRPRTMRPAIANRTHPPAKSASASARSFRSSCAARHASTGHPLGSPVMPSRHSPSPARSGGDVGNGRRGPN